MNDGTMHFYKRPNYESPDPKDYETFCKRTRETFMMLNLTVPDIDKMWEQYLDDVDAMGDRDYTLGKFAVDPSQRPEDAFERVKILFHPDDAHYLIPDWEWPEVSHT